MRGIKTDFNRSGAASQMNDKKGLLERSNEAIGMAAKSPHTKSSKGIKAQMNLNESQEAQNIA